ncbi:DUF6221 family protein [Nocardiopsis mangrovi]|uniref:DUF6221 family protein n=1 Tax=Nocardiopsis mangrovi TaxID=1179818 RepID=A0ABV9DY72_9ACTN
MDIIEFLAARPHGDEAVARAADKAEVGAEWSGRDFDEWRADKTFQPMEPWAVSFPPDTQQHIAHHDPARALREVDAKRRIVHTHRPVPDPRDVSGRVCHAGCDPQAGWPCSTLATWPGCTPTTRITTDPG